MLYEPQTWCTSKLSTVQEEKVVEVAVLRPPPEPVLTQVQIAAREARAAKHAKAAKAEAAAIKRRYSLVKSSDLIGVYLMAKMGQKFSFMRKAGLRPIWKS
jgi:hypothetical protein